MCAATRGMDIPPFVSMTDFPIWAEEGPPNGTLFNYPLKPAHHAEPSIACWPAPPLIAAQMYTRAIMPQMLARATHGGASIAQTIAWAEGELAGFMR